MRNEPTIDPPIELLAISGSLRAASSNTAVLQALAALAPAGLTISLYDRLADLPYFNPDLDGEGATPPSAVLALRERVGQAGGLLISSPEYAHGVPGALKNALDWLVSSLEFPGKPVALINPSPRSIYAQASLAETLVTMSADLIADPAFTLAPPRGLDAAGMLANQQVAAALRSALDLLVAALLSRRG